MGMCAHTHMTVYRLRIGYVVDILAGWGICRVNASARAGNFGDILAGYYAKRMGLPVRDCVWLPWYVQTGS
jgi:threonine synthase